MLTRRGRHHGRGAAARPWAAAALCAALLGGLAAGAAASPGNVAGGREGDGFHTHSGAGGEVDVNVCSDAVAPGVARCLSRVRTDNEARSARPARPGSQLSARAAVLGNNGAYDPPFLQAAYNLSSAASSAGGGETVAIVDAYDDPTAAADLAYYRSFFGLPPCSTGCFTKVNELGNASPLPKADAGWAQEISLDLDMVSAVCPHCTILLVEATSASFADLGVAVATAAAHANAVSNSYGGPEFAGETSFDSYYNHSGVAVTVSSGDSGYGVEYPAASRYVTSVGGTSLYQATSGGSRNATETAWSGAGSGCSVYEPKPAWQTDAGCSMRTVADVSADADPNTGVWAYDSGTRGWAIFGGTSVASPITASTYALAGNTAAPDLVARLYAGGNLNDITSGSNGSCSGSYLCTAGPGYDGPTGMGTPNTPSAFGGGGAPAPTAPGAPTGLTAAPGDTQVSLAWTAPTTNGGSPVTAYKVYRGTTPGGESATPVATVAATGYTDPGLTNGTAYYYTVRAVNAAGTGAPSSEASATPQAPPPAGAPGAPQNLRASARLSGGVRLGWSAPSTTGGSPIAYYVIYRGTTSTSLTALPSHVACTTSSCSYTDSSTSHTTQYWYEVVAYNAALPGPPSNEVSVTAR
jgi:hypothetical protein